jgi:plasmid stability protein
MASLVISQIEESVLRRLRERAREHGRSAEAEAVLILADALLVQHPADPWSVIDAIREEAAASGQLFTDSVDLIREDRDR